MPLFNQQQSSRREDKHQILYGLPWLPDHLEKISNNQMIDDTQIKLLTCFEASFFSLTINSRLNNRVIIKFMPAIFSRSSRNTELLWKKTSWHRNRLGQIKVWPLKAYLRFFLKTLFLCIFKRKLIKKLLKKRIRYLKCLVSI